MSMKSTGARSRSRSRCGRSGMPSTGGTFAALSTTATTSTRAPRAPRSAGRCDCRAMPPAPMTAPPYRFGSGGAGVAIALDIEQATQRRGVPLVNPEEHHEQQAHPHRLDPEEGGDVGGKRGDAQQEEPDVLAEPRAEGEHDALSHAVLGPELLGHAPSPAPQQADELDRAREQLRLAEDVVAVDPRAESLQQCLGLMGIQVLRQVQLAAVPDADREKRIP